MYSIQRLTSRTKTSLNRYLRSSFFFSTIPSKIPPAVEAHANKLNAATQGANYNSKPTLGSALFFGVPIAVTFSLGVWQIRRLDRKQSLIEERQQSLFSDAIKASDLFESGQELDYRRVAVSGRFIHEQEMLVGPRSAPKHLPTPVLQWGGSTGFQVITPFEFEDGNVILVNRGWIPQRLSDPAKRKHAVVSPNSFLKRVDSSTTLCNYGDGDAGEMGKRFEFTAVVRSCDEKNRFTPDNIPSKQEWYYIDATDMLTTSGHGDKSRRHIVVELLEPLPECGWPHPRSREELMQFRTPPSTHITYATTWFCLSASLALLTRQRFKQTARRNL